MALLNEAVDFKKLDVRMIERNITRGVLTQDEVKKAVETLPDDGENADWVSIASLMHDNSETEMNGRGPQHQH